MFAELFTRMILAVVGASILCIVVADFVIFGIQVVILGFDPVRVFGLRRATCNILATFLGVYLIWLL